MAAADPRCRLRCVAGGIAMLACLMLLQGCQRQAPAEPLPPFTPVKSLWLEAALDVNPNLYGRPSPVLLTVFQLNDASAFMQADLAQLLGDAPPHEAAWRVQRTFQLRPGESRIYHFEAEAGLRQIGVVVHYQDPDSAQWRATQDFQARSPEALRVSLARQHVAIHTVSLEEMLSRVQ
ncbi:type VI secretion system lipoprotein TssJ [Pseudomonas sp. GD03860]|uniref:type VI secretion system lipoprotein TssJ n=1 Tax=Pseudomonas TaxID=286 RepID=UPI00236430AA|nr:MULTISPECIES: type VI secretion system lipoprotein TssJ [Pseudomonas]MDD2058589.1 type VI secretion system lipoprotein TssJ [Pseudomonas putida]MDH0639546.1 type VI secretion system lipoprotein TssJ [Pseudomonas sp. GD03860]